ncbi:hypothetical protein ACH5RR_024668 [Cinchona calisaya]|uniref:Uncharacterized protein n=1 Tax=Cinchona calisaya TaxID=153742 RepID=A0ABD2YY89_9GENT
MREKRTMAISKWLCSNSTKNMFVKIVHPGGHIELHDRPIIAADIMRRNPKSCVAYPNVFKQPWAIVAPETTLLPGQKFYVVPISTVRRLQLLSKINSSSQLQESETSTPNSKNDVDSDDKSSGCCLFKNNDHPNKVPYSSLKESENSEMGSNLKGKKDDKCCKFLISGIKTKANNEDKSKERGSSETDALAMKKTKDQQTNSPKRLSSFDSWQPNLQSIAEE